MTPCRWLDSAPCFEEFYVLRLQGQAVLWDGLTPVLAERHGVISSAALTDWARRVALVLRDRYSQSVSQSSEFSLVYEEFLDNFPIGGMGNRLCGGRYSGRQTGKPQNAARSPLSLRADGCAGHWLRFLCRTLITSLRFLPDKAVLPFYVLEVLGSSLDTRLAGLILFLCNMFPIRPRCCCGSLHQHILILPFYSLAG